MYVATALAAGIAGAEPILARKLARLLGQVLPERQAGGAAGNDPKEVESAHWRPSPLVHPVAPCAHEPERIKVIRAAVGNTVRMIPVTDVVCFEAIHQFYAKAHGPRCAANGPAARVASAMALYRFVPSHASTVAALPPSKSA